MRIGIVGAMLEEIALLQKDLQDAEAQARGMRHYSRGTLYGKDVVLVFSRWGKVAAASTVTTLIEVFDVELIIFTGVAGAVSEDLEIGDVIIGSNLIEHDLDASALPGIERFEIPLLGVSSFAATPQLVQLAMKSAERYLTLDLRNDVPAELLAEFTIETPKVRSGLIISGDQFIANPQTLADLKRALPDAQCAEMEGAAVAQVCYEHNVPLIVVRTISDKADHSAAINFPQFVEKVASHFTSGIVKELITTAGVGDM